MLTSAPRRTTNSGSSPCGRPSKSYLRQQRAPALDMLREGRGHKAGSSFQTSRSRPWNGSVECRNHSNSSGSSGVAPLLRSRSPTPLLDPAGGAHTRTHRPTDEASSLPDRVPSIDRTALGRWGFRRGCSRSRTHGAYERARIDSAMDCAERALPRAKSRDHRAR